MGQNIDGQHLRRYTIERESFDRLPNLALNPSMFPSSKKLCYSYIYIIVGIKKRHSNEKGNTRRITPTLYYHKDHLIPGLMLLCNLYSHCSVLVLVM